jgi:hypothetical protein
VGGTGPSGPAFGLMLSVGVAFGQFGGSSLPWWQQAVCYLVGTSVAAVSVLAPWAFHRDKPERRAQAAVYFAAVDLCAAMAPGRPVRTAPGWPPRGRRTRRARPPRCRSSGLRGGHPVRPAQADTRRRNRGDPSSGTTDLGCRARLGSVFGIRRRRRPGFDGAGRCAEPAAGAAGVADARESALVGVDSRGHLAHLPGQRRAHMPLHRRGHRAHGGHAATDPCVLAATDHCRHRAARICVGFRAHRQPDFRHPDWRAGGDRGAGGALHQACRWLRPPRWRLASWCFRCRSFTAWS